MSIWRSVRVAKALLSSTPSLRSSQTLIHRTLPSTHLFPTLNPSPRFFSQAFDSDSKFPDSPEIAGHSGGDLKDGFAPAGSVEEEHQNLELGDVENAQPEEELVADDEEERFQEFLSILKTNVGRDSLRPSLDGLDSTPDEELLVRVVETPELSVENLIGFVSWALRSDEGEPKLRATRRIVDSLVKAASSSGDLRKNVTTSLWDLAKEIGETESSALNSETLNELIAVFSKSGEGKIAMEVFEKFGDFGLVPTTESYYSTFEALCKCSMYDRAWSVCEKMIEAEKMPNDEERLKNIVNRLCKGKRAKDAYFIYTLAKETTNNQSLLRDSLDLLITSLSRDNDTVRSAAELLDGLDATAKQFSAVIKGLCRARLAGEARKLLDKMTDPTSAVFNAVIHGLSKSGAMSEAAETMEVMKRRGLKPDVRTYTILIDGYADSGRMGEACEVLAEAKSMHSKLVPVTFRSLIRGYCRLGAHDKALALLVDMESHGVRPDAEQYDGLVRSLCLKALDWVNAEKLLEEMGEKGLRTKLATRALVRAVKEMLDAETRGLTC